MNFNKNKITLQGKRWKALLFAFFVVLFSQISVGQAEAAGKCNCRKLDTATSFVVSIFDRTLTTTEIDSALGCNNACIAAGGVRYCYYPTGSGKDCNIVDNMLFQGDVCVNTEPTCKAADSLDSVTSTPETVAAVNVIKPVEGICSVVGSVARADFQEAIKCLLYSVFVGMGWLLGLVATLFQWVVEPSNISGGAGLLNQPTVRDVWIMVRDTLNMVFILVLLFSAFCTVFQVDKWNLKKVWLSILINALLVNFSFPIARFFIDVSNVAMYYFLNNLFTGTGQGSGKALISSFSEQSKISTILTPTAYASATTTYMLAGIVFTFILGMTLLVLAVLFVIRLIALTMLLMFSPIGFVGNIFPEMNKFASDWWSNLFKHAFFGPVMVFMMMVAIAIMKATPDTFTQAATGNVGLGGVDANWIGSAAFFSIPIIILWTAMGISQKMGVAGADKVVGAAKKWGGKAAMFMSGAGKAQNFFKKQKDTFAASRKKRSDELDKKTLGSRFGDRMNDTQDKFGGEKGQKRHDKRKEAKNKDDIKNGAEEKDNMAMPILKTEANSAVGRVGTVLTDEEKKNDAIIAKVAINRGAKYEKEIEDDARNVMEAGFTRKVNRVGIHLDFDRKKNAHARVKDNLSNHELTKLGPLKGTETAEQIAAYTATMADWSATRAQLKDAVDKAKKEVEIEEKKLIQTVKTEHIDKLRKVVQAGEDIKKIKPRI